MELHRRHRLHRVDRESPAAARQRQRGAVRRGVPPQNQDPTLAATTHARRDARCRRTSCARTSATTTSTCGCSTPTRTTTGCRLQADRRFSGGLFLNVNYTWSKALDTQSGQRRLLAHRRQRQGGELRPGQLRSPAHLQRELGLRAAAEGIGGTDPRRDHQRLAAVGRLSLESGAPYGIDVQRQRREQPERDRFTHGRLPAGDQRRSGQGLYRAIPYADDQHERLRARRRSAASGSSRVATT